MSHLLANTAHDDFSTRIDSAWFILFEWQSATVVFGQRIGVESLDNSNIGVLSVCVFKFIAHLNRCLFVHILARHAIPIAKH